MDSRTINLRGIAGNAGKNIMQGIGGFVFGNENNASSEDSHVERYLDRISNGVIAEDRRSAMTELQSLVAESRQAQMAFGAMGFPVLLTILREERDDVELIRGALETLISSLTPLETSNGPKNEIQAASMNSDLLSRETENISLLLGLLSEDDFYVRYYTLQLLTALLTNSPKRLQEAILSIPRGITGLMDMLMDREVIRNEALLLLTYLTREAEEIQKIVVFEGAFEKIFSIIREEGASDGGVVVQDCLELLKNLIRHNASNQILLRETIGYDPLVSILKLRRGSAYNFTQQKTVNLLNALETVELLLIGGPTKDSNKQDNQTSFAQKNILSHLLLLGVESQWAPVSVRCMALRCTGDLVKGNPNNLKQLASKQVGEEPQLIPALNAIFSISLRTQFIQEFLSADYVIKCFCEKNPEGQALLASTIPDPNSLSLNPIESTNLPFGSMLLQALVAFASNQDSETCCRAASALSHILKDNLQCKEKVLKIELESSIPSLSLTKEPLLHQIVKYLALISSKLSKEKSQNQTFQNQNSSYLLPLLLKLLIIWLENCPNAVSCILSQPTHLTYLFELVSNPNSDIYTSGLTALVLGQCVLYNKNSENSKDSFAIVDSISQKLSLTSYFTKFDELAKIFKSSLSATSAQNSKPLSRTNTASMIDTQDTEEVLEENNIKDENENPIFLEVFDVTFIGFVSKLEKEIREGILDIFGNTKSKVLVLPAELEQRNGELDGDYVKRLRAFLEKQCNEMQDLLARNATLAEELVRSGNTGTITGNQNTIKDRVQTETLKRDLLEASRLIETLKSENSTLKSESSNFKSLAMKLESDLKSLSDAYNSMEQSNVQMEKEIGDLRNPNFERMREEAREEAQRESEGELNDLLVCLGQEQSKVERLSARLAELGEDVEKLLEGIGEDSAALQDETEGDDDE